MYSFETEIDAQACNVSYLETRLVQVTVVSGYYAFEACFYYLPMVEVDRYLYHKGYTKKRKPQIDSWFLNILHILGQEKIFFFSVQGYYRLLKMLPYIPIISGMPKTEATN